MDTPTLTPYLIDVSAKSPLYDQNFFAWRRQQADLLRAGDLARADIEHIAEEIESLGRTERRELISRLTVLMLHLLNWRHQPEKRGASWEASIRVQRNRLADHLEDNPSLKPLLPQALLSACRDAALEAVGRQVCRALRSRRPVRGRRNRFWMRGFGRGEAAAFRWPRTGCSRPRDSRLEAIIFAR
jgi:Domain of unknown function DUF29